LYNPRRKILTLQQSLREGESEIERNREKEKEGEREREKEKGGGKKRKTAKLPGYPRFFSFFLKHMTALC